MTFKETLRATSYHDEGIYQQERANIFGKDWLLIGHEAMWSEPGSYLALSIAQWPILIIRGQDGSLKAFHNVCAHRASMILEEGMGRATALRCLYHGWVYDQNGHLAKAPNFGEEDALLCSDIKLKSINLEIWNNLVFISLSNQPDSFSASLGDFERETKSVSLEHFVFHSYKVHRLNCNWKTYVENYAEGYHIPYVHPGLNEEVDMSTYEVTPHEKIAVHSSDPRESDKTGLNDGLWVWHWPYAALNVYKSGMNLEIMVPDGPEHTNLHYYYLFDANTDEQERLQTISMSQEVTAEDRKVCEIVHKNIKAGIYSKGKLSPHHEKGVSYFQDLWREVIKE